MIYKFLHWQQVTSKSTKAFMLDSIIYQSELSGG